MKFGRVFPSFVRCGGAEMVFVDVYDDTFCAVLSFLCLIFRVEMFTPKVADWFKYVDNILYCRQVVRLKKTSEVVSARLSKQRIRLIEEIAEEERVDKSTIIDRALEHYTKEWTLQRALELYRNGIITLARAAEMAGLSIWEMIDILEKKKIALQYDAEDFEEDMKTIGRG